MRHDDRAQSGAAGSVKISIDPGSVVDPVHHGGLRLLSRIPARRHATPAQIALAWPLTHAPWIVPIPRTRKVQRLEENLAAAAIQLTADDFREIDAATPGIEVRGARGTGREQYT